MRYRVDLRYGSASFDEKDLDKAHALYEREGIRLSVCSDLFDEGIVIDGLPLEVDVSSKRWEVA